MVFKKKKSNKVNKHKKKISRKIFKGGVCEVQTSHDDCNNYNETCVWKSKYNIIDIDKNEAEKNEEGECHTNCKLIEDYDECMRGPICRWIDLNQVDLKDTDYNKNTGICF
jgi:hypothetical protein